MLRAKFPVFRAARFLFFVSSSLLLLLLLLPEAAAGAVIWGGAGKGQGNGGRERTRNFGRQDIKAVSAAKGAN